MFCRNMPGRAQRVLGSSGYRIDFIEGNGAARED
jgi:hypothetical protein